MAHFSPKSPLFDCFLVIQTRVCNSQLFVSLLFFPFFSSLNDQQITFLIFCESVPSNLAGCGEREDHDRIGLGKFFFEIMFDPNLNVLKNSVAVLDFKNRILEPVAVFLQILCESSSESVVRDIVRDQKHFTPP